MNIYQKLLIIQKAVKGLSKDKKSYSFSYVTGNKLLGFIKPLMDQNGLILKQEILSIENERMNYKVKSGDKSEILSKVMMRFTWIDTETGEKDENLFGANGQNGFEMGLGSALTYGERYFLLKYFHIATDEDDIDNPERKDNSIDVYPNHQTPSEPIKIDRIKARLEACTTIESLQSTYKSLTPSEQKAAATITTAIKQKLTLKSA